MSRLGISAVLLVAAIFVGAMALASARGVSEAPAGRVSVPAPIDRVETLIRESAPPQVTLKLTAGLPSGCAQRESHGGETQRGHIHRDRPQLHAAGESGVHDDLCHQLSVELAGEFRPGVTYTVHVSDKTTTFKL